MTGPNPPRPIELLWLDPRRTARIRRRPAWRRVLDDAPRDAVAPSLPGQDVTAEDRRDLLLILARGDATDREGVAAALSESVREDGKLAPCLVLVAGELRLPFDELETLRATVTTATPFVPGDDALRAAVDAAKAFLALPGLCRATTAVDAMTVRIREAFGRTKRAVPPDHLEAQTERALLEQRRYQKRVFRGETHLRALLQAPGEKASSLVYLPEAVADRLPLFPRFGARMIAEARLSVDQYEAFPHGLEAVALARELPAPAGRPR